MTCVIGTRGSALALWQADAVKRAILAVAPAEHVEVRVISTRGDRVLDQPLEQIGGKGLFTGELERELASGGIDLCVHSMKDVPTELAPGCAIAAMLPRADVRDVLVCGPRIEARSLAEVPKGARIGTGSLRRSAQLRALHPQIAPKPIRGNVDTRLAKAAGGDYEGVILAAAGVERMGALDQVSCWISIDEMLPAAGQGAIGVEARLGDVRMAELCSAIDDVPTSTCVRAERLVLAALEGGCQVPLGVYARFKDDELVVNAGVFSLDGMRQARAGFRGAEGPETAAYEVVGKLLLAGADAILAEIREGGA